MVMLKFFSRTVRNRSEALKKNLAVWTLCSLWLKKTGYNIFWDMNLFCDYDRAIFVSVTGAVRVRCMFTGMFCI